MTQPFRNTHLSYSRLSRFEQCPLSFKLQYIDKLRSEPGVPLKFGKLIHAVLEVLVQEHCAEELTSPLSEDRALVLFKDGWAKEGLVGVELFQEGLQILRDFVRDQGELNHRDVLALEQKFLLKVGRFTVLGFIDRIDWVDDETIEVIDYKTNRMLFTRDEVNHSLQMSLYELAVRQLYPWVKNVRLTFHMLRHNLRMRSVRTQDQLDAALEYVDTLGRATEEATEYPARINTNCVWCDHKTNCSAYADALKGKREEICEDIDDLEAVAKEREEVANLAKLLYARKSELEKVLKGHLKDQDELILGGIRYRMFATRTVSYPLSAAVQVLASATGESEGVITERIAGVDKKALDKLFKEIGKDQGSPRVKLLKAELEAVGDTAHSPRFSAKAVKS